MTFKSFYRYATGMRLKCIRKNVLFQHQLGRMNARIPVKEKIISILLIGVLKILEESSMKVVKGAIGHD
jgi:hypothetical protein